ncbi:MAG TPA: DUF92 domain-containing protein [Gemmatimonadales bacterium]|nr:DUF92 domain-containing protein [Gemmatimonadales bacterium]
MKWLTRRGTVAALAVGLATLSGFGWRGLGLLLAFFISGSLLTAAAKGSEKGGGGGRRNARQVIANGGVAALAALAGSWVWFAGALAAANADTWATEIGSHSPSRPRLITNGQPVPAGTDGGITLLGTAGGIAGALFMAALATLLAPGGGESFVTVALAGIAGMLVDSLLGATLQGRLTWLDNDAVNLAATAAGAGAAPLFGMLS